MQPIIEGEHWKGPELFHLEANQQKKPYKVTYAPQTMSSENMNHQVRELCQHANRHGVTLIVHAALGRRLDKMTFRGPVQAEGVLCSLLEAAFLVARGQAQGKGRWEVWTDY